MDDGQLEDAKLDAFSEDELWDAHNVPLSRMVECVNACKRIKTPMDTVPKLVEATKALAWFAKEMARKGMPFLGASGAVKDLDTILADIEPEG